MRKIYEIKRTIDQLDPKQKRELFRDLASKLDYSVYEEHYKKNGHHNSTYARNIGRYGEPTLPKIEFVEAELPKMINHVLELITIFEDAIAEVALEGGEADEGGEMLF